MCVWHNSTRICSKSIEFRHSAQKVKETSTRTTRRTLGVGGWGGRRGCESRQVQFCAETGLPQFVCMCEAAGSLCQHLLLSVFPSRSRARCCECVRVLFWSHRFTHLQAKALALSNRYYYYFYYYFDKQIN